MDNDEWGSIYLGDTSGLPSELVGLTIVVQSRSGQSWTTTVTAVLDRNSGQVIVTDSGRPALPLISGSGRMKQSQETDRTFSRLSFLLFDRNGFSTDPAAPTT